MAKKKNSTKTNLESLVSSALPIVEFKHKDPLFQVACHPEKPIVVSGTATGYIFCHQYDATVLQEAVDRRRKSATDDSTKKDKNEKFWAVVEVPSEDTEDIAGIKLLWKTKRHKESVRGIALDSDGKYMYSVSSDNVLKKSETETGKVLKKITLSEQPKDAKFTKIVKSSTHPFLVLGDEVGNVLVLDSETLQEKNKLIDIHDGKDAINDIFHFSRRSAYKFISLGQTTLGYWDARESNQSDKKILPDDTDSKRMVLLSDDQEDEILCGTFVDPEVGDTIVCGMGEGLLTVWKPEKNGLEDQLTRIKIAADESIDCIIPTLQDDNCIWCGCSNGKIYKANAKSGKVIEIRKHSNLDEVAFLDLDCEYRVISGGMDSVKIWELNDVNVEVKDNSNKDESDFSMSDSDISISDSDEENEDNSVNEDEEVEVPATEEWAGFESETSDTESVENDDEKGLIGLSKEQLMKELDKDILGLSDSDNETNSKRKTRGSKFQKKQKKQKIQKEVAHNDNHGITKFEGL
ncbi:hypothetical protein TPHA_0I03160 [Tetrapisispora phaffii CBS 4417]|uniref:WD repeat-containing protein JIP5 n=1 Tax=Tetrapisispora phaffii (strain ATCC 24235 / CBS 4417 / NBRC 1672 / NRRL Y-8282 / UCD 70-5) TaxID=1071381 RepID=G8BY39_TETPH|nr:hypothetical protein TPHA_0I03160 [Tetrapisispora phaffii CBS 4417]CCE64817.1 hypothetical protein TPHA_0I03160 [Tetrapisispora phaffii CBS 4417]